MNIQKLEADYRELALSYLDNLEIKKLKDFEFIKHALKSLLELDSSNSPELQNRVIDLSGLKELLDNPEIYVEQPNNYAFFITIIKDQIQLKINEIENLTDEEKRLQIERLQERRNLARQHQELIRSIPTRTPSILSEEESLRQVYGNEEINSNQQRRMPRPGPPPRQEPRYYSGFGSPERMVPQY